MIESQQCVLWGMCCLKVKNFLYHFKEDGHDSLYKEQTISLLDCLRKLRVSEFLTL